MITLGHMAAILDNLPLTRNDRALVDKFIQDPDGRGFLSVAEILNEFNYTDESLELLQIGVAKHKRYTAARVVLAKSFFARGMIEEALDMIENSPVSLHLNIMAQKIKLKAMLILNNEKKFRQVLDHLISSNALDEECERLGQHYYIDGFAKARAGYIQDLSKRGIVVNYSDMTVSDANVSYSHVKPAIADLAVLPVADIFSAGEQDRSPAAVVLETETMAQVYEDQGQYSSALQVYSRLAKKHPTNSFYQQKIVETIQLLKKTSNPEYLVNFGVVAKVEQYDRINFKMEVCRRFLQRLSC
ncbi:MAG: hypothetical protein OYH77_00940 [Pseudomonadota bacterium]|nr:hypothetical protein [Pseudomonadota bacterium]